LDFAVNRRFFNEIT